jgi:hypothetical protein
VTTLLLLSVFALFVLLCMGVGVAHAAVRTTRLLVEENAMLKEMVDGFMAREAAARQAAREAEAAAGAPRCRKCLNPLSLAEMDDPAWLCNGCRALGLTVALPGAEQSCAEVPR